MIYDNVEVFLAPSFTGKNLFMSQLTAHPYVVLPSRYSKGGKPTSVCFIGRLFGEAPLLAVAKKYQDSTDFHHRHPNLDDKARSE